MTRQDFADKLAELLEIDEQLTPETNLRNMNEYDSMAVLSIIAFVDKEYKKTLLPDELAKITTIDNLISLIGSDHFE